LRFDIIVFTDKADEINGEIEQYSHFFKDIKHYIVTYGFNLKASMTTSSIGDLVAKKNIYKKRNGN